MDGFLCLSFSSFLCRKHREILAVFWIAGLLLGALAARYARTFLSGFESVATGYDVSFLGLMAVSVLPLSFSILAIIIAKKWLLILVAFVKAFLFSYLWMSFASVLGNSEWLLRALFMFGDVFSLPVLWWIWLHIDTPIGRHFFLRFLCASVIVFLIVCIDYAIVVPFCAHLI